MDEQEAFHKEMGQDPDKSDENIRERNDFMGLYEESLKNIRQGEIVKGEVIQADKEYVLVDIGYKSEGQIPTAEFIDSEGNLTVKVGDIIEVLLVRKEDKNGRIILSREKAAESKIWDEIKEIYEKDGTIRGKILFRQRGGMAVDIGPQAFLPGSQIDLKPIRDFDSLIGTSHDFKVLKYNRQQENIVLSRRAILEEERKVVREKTLQGLEEGAVLEGTVKNIQDYGLFIDLGGIDGLLHIKNMSWGRIGHPSEMFQVGDKITVKILNFEREKERLSLGIKQLNLDPWEEAKEKYTSGARVKGRVVDLKNYGAFVELEEGVEGLAHISEMSWTRKLRHPSQIVQVGDIIDVVVLNIDPIERRISLGLKQLEPNPWDGIGERYPIGSIIEGRIKDITDFGAFIELEEGIEGLIYLSEIPEEKREKTLLNFQIDDSIQVEVINVSEEEQKIGLSVRSVEETTEMDIS